MARTGIKAAPWSTKAGLSKNQLGQFMGGSAKTIKLDNLKSLARAVNLPLAALTLEMPDDEFAHLLVKITLLPLPSPAEPEGLRDVEPSFQAESDWADEERHQIDCRAAIDAEHRLGGIPVNTGMMAKRLGLRIVDEDLPDNISGAIRKDPDASPSGYLIAVNRRHHINRRRFTVAHEIAHYVLHRAQIGDGYEENELRRDHAWNGMEVEANEMAADILMPPAAVDQAVKEGVETVEDLARRFMVSEEAMRRRLKLPPR